MLANGIPDYDGTTYLFCIVFNAREPSRLPDAALPEASAENPGAAKALGYYSHAGLSAVRASVAPDGIALGRAVAPVLATRILRSLGPGAT